MSPPETAAPLAAGIEFACAVLDQADDMVRLCNAHPGLRYGEHVGPHLRHIVEHFGEFLDGIRLGRIDYDGRQRERALEREPALMRSRIAAVQALLRKAEPALWPRSIAVAAQGGVAGEDEFVCQSTPLRELLFLASHATHHYALLKLAIEMRGVKLDADFGKAPATLRYERDAAARKAA